MKKNLLAFALLLNVFFIKAQLSVSLSSTSGCAPFSTTVNFFDPSANSYQLYISGPGVYVNTNTFLTTYNYTFNTGGYYYVDVYGLDGFGSQISYNWATVYVSGPSANLGTSAEFGACPNDQVYSSIYFYDFIGGNTNTYDWNNGDGVVYSQIPYDYIYSSYPNVGSYTVTVNINSSTCGNYSASDTVIISTLSTTIPSFSSDVYPNDSVCPLDPIYLASPGIYTIYKDYGDGTYESGSNSNHSYAAYGTYFTSITAINGCGNAYTVYDTVYVIPGLPNLDAQVSIGMSDSIACPNTNIYFAPNYYSNSNFQWDFGNGDITTQQNPDRSFPISGIVPITLTTYNGCGSPKSTTRNLYIVDTISASIITLNMTDSICPGTSFLAEASSNNYYGSGSIYYTYNFGDTIITGEDFVGHIYNTPGVYTVTASYQNGCGNTGSVTQSIYVGSAAGTQMSTIFNSPMDQACPGDTMFFILFPAGGNMNYSIDFGDGSPLSVNAGSLLNGPQGLNYTVIKHVYVGAGAYIATCTFSSPCGGSYQQSITVDINSSTPPNETGFFYDDSKNYCLGDQIDFYGYGANELTWDFGDGSGNLVTYGMLNAIPHTYNQPGNYTITLIGKNSCGLQDTSTETINMEDTRISIITNQVASSCGQSNGKAIAIASGGTGPYQYTWTNGDNSFIADSIPAGIYVVNITDKIGCKNYAIATVSDVQAPTILVTNTIDASCYAGQDGTIDITVVGSSAPYNFVWSNGKTTEDVNNLVAGPYEVTVTDANGCEANKSISIGEPDEFIVSFTSNMPDCGFNNGVLQANISGNSGPYYYIWNNGSTSNVNAGISAGIYDLVVIDSKGCLKEISTTLNNAGAPVIGVDSITPLNCGTGGAAIYITSYLGSGSHNYSWNNGVSNFTTQDVTGIISSGSYSLTVTDGAGCSSNRVFDIVETEPVGNPICLVTVDTTTYTNKVVWEEVTQPNLKSFNIYRESSQAGLYYLVGNVDKDSLHEYVDAVADPSIRPWRYKVSAISDCGTESEISMFHKTIHLTINKGLTDSTYNLIWDDYEGQNTYTTFYIWRYKNTTGWVKIDSLSKLDHSYTDYVNGFSSLTDLFYFVEAGPLSSCDPSRALINTSRSNIKQLVFTPDTTGTIGMNEVDLNDDVMVYPNPTKGQITIKADSKFGKTKLEITNVLGQMLYTESLSFTTKIIDLSNFANGIYFVKVYHADKTISKKIMLNK